MDTLFHLCACFFSEGRLMDSRRNSWTLSLQVLWRRFGVFLFSFLMLYVFTLLVQTTYSSKEWNEKSRWPILTFWGHDGGKLFSKHDDFKMKVHNNIYPQRYSQKCKLIVKEQRWRRLYECWRLNKQMKTRLLSSRFSSNAQWKRE